MFFSPLIGCHTHVSGVCVRVCVLMHVFVLMFQAYLSFLAAFVFVSSGLGCCNQAVGHQGSPLGLL